MTTVLEAEERMETMVSDINMFSEFENKFGICVTDFNSLNGYVAALLGCVSTKKLILCYQLPSDEFRELIKYELRKREVFV